jgi:hypothetical protein
MMTDQDVAPLQIMEPRVMEIHVELRVKAQAEDTRGSHQQGVGWFQNCRTG